MTWSLVLLVHAAATLFMAGLIWFVQVVHYPLFARVGEGESAAYADAHQRRTSWVVGPVMLVELVTAVVLLWAPLPAGTMLLRWSGIALLVVIWLSTALVQVPCHRRLAGGFDRAAIDRLVATNWVRTIGWSVRGVLALALIAAAASSAGGSI